MMRRTFLLGPVCLALFAGNPKPHHLPTIDRLNDTVQRRFQNPLPDTLGMSRVAMPLSMGTHFRPIRGRATDFVPETTTEREVLASLEADGVQVGLYVVGVNTLTVGPEALSYRSLKGPAAITRNTPRPAWYPGERVAPPAADALPDWKAIYPLAKDAMRRFKAGEPAFETRFAGWDIAARPVQAVARCIACHDGGPKNILPTRAHGPTGPAATLGAVLYAFRSSRR